jgi:hypothetical protein
VVSLEKNCHSVRVQHGFQGIGALLPDPFLHSKAL